MSAATASRISLRGIVEATYYSGPRFTAGRLRTNDGSCVNFAGKVFAKENDAVVLEGTWTKHPKYGHQFAAESMGHDLELSPDGLANYLANHPEVKGIGPVKAKLIAERFGTDFERVLRDDPSAVADTAKVPLETIQELQRIWIAAADFNVAMAYLSAYDLTHHQVTTLVDKFGSQVVSILERDPYVLIREIPGFGFKRVDKIARKMGTPKDLPSRIRAGIHYCVLAALDDGHCWVEYETLLNRANKLLIMDTLDSREVIERHLERLIDEKKLICSVTHRIVVGDLTIYDMEGYLSAFFLAGDAPNPVVPHVADLDGLLDVQAPTLNPVQREAVKNALLSSVSLITGGAGSGKTYTLSRITRIAQRFGLDVALAAPTGKAAKRMEESVRREASTIHRLLGFDGHSFRHSENNPITTDILIVDEMSMVDVPLAHQLFQSVDLEKTAVVLVGDHNQLPPIGPGHVLRDLVQSKPVPTTFLTDIVRQAGELKECSTAVLRGEVRPTSEIKANGRRPWYVVDKFTDREDVRRFLLLLFDEVLSERLGYDLIRDVQVLTPTHKGPLGTVELNIALQRLLQKKLYGVDVAETPPGRRPRLYPGDKVIQTKNDYELGVMNGSMGSVCSMDSEWLVIDFDGRPVRISRGSSAEQNIQLALACSVHRVQGSEFPCAVVITHKSHAFMHHRNLLYTAVTRAKESVIILGDRWGISNCAEQVEVNSRNTNLSFLLGEI